MSAARRCPSRLDRHHELSPRARSRRRAWASANSFLSTRSESASAIADARSSEFGNAWNNRTSASFDAASDAAHATTRRAEREKVTSQRMRSKRCLLVSIGLLVSARSTHTHNARGTPLLPALARPKQAEKLRSDGVERRRGLRTESGRFHTEIPPDATADQPGGSIGSPVDHRAGVRPASLRLHMARAAQIDRDGAEELTMCRRLSSNHDVYRADVWRDGPEDAVLGVRAFLVGDWNVDNGNPDSHCRHEGKLRASGNSYGVSLYCFILRQSVTVLIFRASAARFRLPLKRSSARRINSRSCDRIFKGSPSGAPFFF